MLETKRVVRPDRTHGNIPLLPKRQYWQAMYVCILIKYSIKISSTKINPVTKVIGFFVS